MGSGAYSVFIDQQAGGGPTGALQRVVPPSTSGEFRGRQVQYGCSFARL